MPHRHAVILRAADVARAEVPLVQRLNPSSKFQLTALGRLAGFERVGVSRGRIPPGGNESFAYHAHLREEEWVYLVSGRARARIGGQVVELAAGDFVGYPAPQAPHVLANPYDEDCVYLMGGERSLAPDVLDYPDLGKRYVLVRDAVKVAFHELGPAEFPFGRADLPVPTAASAAWRVLGTKGCGSVIAEAALTVAGIAFDHEEVDYSASGPARDRLRALNPLGQVPTVVLPDGRVMTETLAIVLHADEVAPAAGLLPAVGDPQRREALRWLVFLIAAMYPTWTYGDEPAKWVGEGAAADELRRATDAHRLTLWRQLEAAAVGPWFLGARRSVIDLYVGVMTNWRPGRAWFTASCPRLAAIATAVAREPELAALFAANF